MSVLCLNLMKTFRNFGNVFKPVPQAIVLRKWNKIWRFADLCQILRSLPEISEPEQIIIINYSVFQFIFSIIENFHYLGSCGRPGGRLGQQRKMGRRFLPRRRWPESRRCAFSDCVLVGQVSQVQFFGWVWPTCLRIIFSHVPCSAKIANTGVPTPTPSAGGALI